jgi:maleylacetoacetate isomerase
MLLHDYFRSSAAFRVRIALALKGLSPERRFVNLLRDGGEQKLPAYRAKNPQALVPTLELDDGTALTQSLAIIEYLDTVQPQPRLIPQEPVLAAKARAVALAVACDIHPLGNLRVIHYLQANLALDETGVAAWRSHWIREGLAAVEKLIEPGPFCFGATPTIADIALAPQAFNALLFVNGPATTEIHTAVHAPSLHDAPPIEALDTVQPDAA